MRARFLTRRDVILGSFGFHLKCSLIIVCLQNNYAVNFITIILVNISVIQHKQ